MLSFFQVLLWGLVAMALLLLVLVLVAAAIGQYSFWQSFKRASSSPCPRCARIVGQVAVRAAKEAHAQKVQKMMQQHPGVKFRQIAEWEIECPHCGFKFYFYPSSNKLETVSIFANKHMQPTPR